MDETFETPAGIPIRGIVYFMVLPVLVTIIALTSLLTTDLSELAVGTPLVVTPNAAAPALVQRGAAAKTAPAHKSQSIVPMPASAPDLGVVYERALAAYDQGKFGEAVALFREVLTFAPDSAVVYNSLGTALVRMGDLEAALEAFEQAAALDSGHNLAQYNRAVTLFNLERFAESERAFLELLTQDPGNARAAFGLAGVYIKTGRLADAEAAYEKAVRADPTYAQAYLELGLLQAAQGQWSKAEDTLEAGLETAPDSLEIQYHLGLVYAERGDLRAARLTLAAVVANDPEGDWGNQAKEALAQLGSQG